MKKIGLKFTTSILSAALLTACNSNNDNKSVVSFDLARASQTEQFNNLKIKDFKYVALDTVSKALLGERAMIESIAGDTVIISDNLEKVLLFTLSDGKMIGEINHKGQEPGEYSWLDHIYVDRQAREVVLNTPNNFAHRYTFSDSLVNTYHYDTPSTMRLSIGSLSKGINMYEQRESGFVIHQLDKNFQQTDSIVIDGYKLGYRSGSFSNLGDEGVITIVDTLYTIKPGKLEKLAILDRDGKTITPEIEEELNQMMQVDFEGAMKKQNEYINLLGWFASDNDKMEVTYQLGETTFFDFFRMNDGKLLAHLQLSDTRADKKGLPVEYEGSTLYLNPIFCQDGIWYAVIPENATIEAEKDADNVICNAAIASFRLEEE